MSPQYRVVVAWTNSEEYYVEAEDAEEASDTALDTASDEHPFADDYEIVFEPELRADPTAPRENGGETK